MCALMERLKDEISKRAIVNRCAKEGCEVSLRNAPSPHLVIDVDDPSFGLENKSHCDFLFISCDCASGANWVVPLELKRGSPNATAMVNQLQAGAGFAQDRIPAKHKTRFLPIGVYGGRLHTNQRDRLRKARILFRGKKYEIELIRCGTPLKNVLP